MHALKAENLKFHISTGFWNEHMYVI